MRKSINMNKGPRLGYYLSLSLSLSRPLFLSLSLSLCRTLALFSLFTSFSLFFYLFTFSALPFYTDAEFQAEPSVPSIPVSLNIYPLLASHTTEDSRTGCRWLLRHTRHESARENNTLPCTRPTLHKVATHRQ